MVYREWQDMEARKMITRGALDINVTHHCNKKCSSCSHYSPFAPKFNMTPEAMARDLEAIKPFIRFQNINLVGGEPLLSPTIVEMMRIAKASGVASGLTVITNGTRLPLMKEEFWKELNFLQISIYSGLPEEIVILAKEKQKQFGFGLGTTVFTEFYVQLEKEPTDGKVSFRDCPWRKSCFTLHDGAFYLCPQSAFANTLFPNIPKEGLPLDGLTEEKLQAFLDRDVPFKACTICTGGIKKTRPWSESKTKAEWLINSTDL